MPKRTQKKQGPEDINEIAFRVVSEATSESPHKQQSNKPLIGRQGGLKGGKERAKKLTPEQRSEIAKLAASARWKKTVI